MSGVNLVPYVSRVLDEQDAYREAMPAVVPRAVRAVSAPLAGLSQWLIPVEVVEAAIKGADWVASASIREATLAHDFSVLEECDAAARDVRRWALGYAATGGGAAGALGAAGLAIDIPATMTLALRTARLTGLAYGFGGKGASEQIYILDILQLAAANSLDDRQAAIARLAEGRKTLSEDDWHKVAEMTGHAAGASVAARRAAETLGVNLSVRKLAQVTPVVGAAVGASVNASFQSDVAAAARFAFRARWLEVNEGIVEGDAV